MADVKFGLKTVREMEELSDADIAALTEQDAKKHLITAVAEVKSLNKKLADLGTEKQDLEKDNRDLVNENKDLEKDKRDLTNEKQDLENQFQQKETDLANSLASEKTLKEQLGDANDKQAKETERAEQLHKQTVIILEQLDDYEKLNKKLKTENDDFRIEQGVQVNVRQDLEDKLDQRFSRRNACIRSQIYGR